jgi:serine phosphatase RsbU (regulator of sigma subunit)
MKKATIFSLLFFCFINNGIAQFKAKKTINVKDSLELIERSTSYVKKHMIFMNLGKYYQYYKGDSAIGFFLNAVDIARANNDQVNLYISLSYLSITARQTVGNYPLALSSAIESLKVANSIKNKNDIKREWCLQNLAQTYASLNNKNLALKYINETWPISERSNPDFRPFELARTYFEIGEYDSSNVYIKKSVDFENAKPFEKRIGTTYIGMANVYSAKKFFDSAIIYYKLSIPHSYIKSVRKDYLEATSGMAKAYFNLNQIDSAIHYSNEVVKNSIDFTYNEGLLISFNILYKSFKIGNKSDSALKYLEKYEQLTEKLHNASKNNDAQNLALLEVAKLKELEEEKALQQKKLIIISIVLILSMIAVFIYGKRKQKLLIQKNEEDRKNKELQAAKDLQLSLLPKNNPKRSDLDISTYIRSSTEVGGDYYDFSTSLDGTIISICGDATGHGVASGMMVSVTKAGLKGIGIEKLSVTLYKLNNVVKEMKLGVLRMSLNMAKISSNSIELCSAAMPPVYLFKAINNSVEEISEQGLPLGGLKNADYETITRSFEPGDVLIQLSDGLPEAPSKNGEMYDYDRLKALIQTACSQSSQEIINTLVQSVDLWMGGSHNPDDITLVVIKKK